MSQLSLVSGQKEATKGREQHGKKKPQALPASLTEN